MEMGKLTKAKIAVTGGTMNTRSFSVNGMDGIRCLEKVNFDIALLGLHAMHQYRFANHWKTVS